MIAAIQNRPGANDVCAFYGRVSTPRQKIDQQVELAKTWCQMEHISIAQHHWFSDIEKRHKADKRSDFQSLLQLCRDGDIDWVVVATFDRWGVADIDEYFEYRRLLKDAGVRLWSIQDNLELTSADSIDVQRIFSLAVAATLQMEFYADRNAMKMIERALGGWHLSINHPYGTDLVCCRLSDRKPLFRVHQLTKPTKGPKEYLIQQYDDDGEVESGVHVNRAPLRDCKETGYRLSPSIDVKRVKTVRLIFDLYDKGFGNGAIAKTLESRGMTYFGKNWGWQCIEAILYNPAYKGLPAWGKIATGQYRHVYDGRSQKPRKKPTTGAISYNKDEKHYVYPREPVFKPIVPVALFDRVQAKRSEARAEDRSHYRQRSPAKHPLSGLIVCPDCGAPMDLHSSQSKGNEPIRYFICATYAKTRRRKCRANSVRWKSLDGAAGVLLEQVESHLASVEKLSPKHFDIDKMFTEFFDLSIPIISTVEELVLSLTGEKTDFPQIDYLQSSPVDVKKHHRKIATMFQKSVKQFEKDQSKSLKQRQKRLSDIDSEIEHFHELAEETPSKDHRKKYWQRVDSLQAERERLAGTERTLRGRLAMLLGEAKAMKRSIGDMKSCRDANLWRALVQRVVPIFDYKQCKDGIERSYLQAIRFEPHDETKQVLDSAMKLQCTRKGRGSWQRRA